MLTNPFQQFDKEKRVKIIIILILIMVTIIVVGKIFFLDQRTSKKRPHVKFGTTETEEQWGLSNQNR